MNKKQLRYRNMKTNKILTGAAITAAVVGGATQVSADTVETTDTTTGVVETVAETTVTQADVEQAQAEVTQAQTDVIVKTSETGAAYNAQTEAQTAEAEAQAELVEAQETAETATPEAIQEVEAEIVETETTVSETETLLETAEQEASTAQEQADQAQAVADSANTAYTEAQAQADAAQETVAQLENETVDVDQAQTTVDTAKQEVVTAEANVAEAEQALVTAQESDQSLAQNIAEAKTTLDEAKVAETNAQTKVVGLEAQVADTANKVTEAQAVVDSLKNEVSYTIDINLPQEVKDAVKKFMTTPKTVETVAELEQAIGSSDFAINYDNYWKIDVTGGEELVDLNNLTNKQVEMLNQVVVDMYNKLAENVGLNTVTANSKMIELAKVRSEKYDEADSPQGHNTAILRESEDEVFTSPLIMAGENLAFGAVTTSKTTMGELLKTTKDYLMGLTVFDSESAYGHWTNIDTSDSLGMYLHVEETDKQTILNTTFETTWLVMAVYRDLFTAGGLHTNAIAANEEVHAADVTFTNDSSSLTAANTQLALANVAHNRAKADLAQAVTVLNQAKAEVVSATNAYNTLLSTESETAKAQANLDAANTKLSEAQAKYDSALMVLTALTESKEAKAQALADAKAAFDTAQAKADELRADYLVKQADADELKADAEQASQAVQALEAILVDAKQAVVDAKAKLVDLKEAEANLLKAQEAYDKAVTTRQQAEAKYQPLYDRYLKVSVEELAKDPEARAMGNRLYQTYCMQCHGADARGAKGFPNLTDNDWLYGGSAEKIHETLVNGRIGQMPAFGAAFGEEKVRDTANYVLSLSGKKHDAERATRGKEAFNAVCAACHGPDGKGNQAIGAPNLTDNVWLYGSTEKVIMEGITNGRKNQMPAWNEFLGEGKIHLLTAYVWGLSNNAAK